MTDKSYEVIVIGGGPGGYAAAIRLAQLGLKTLCVERESMGGICLNWGCIPSKALIAATSLVQKIQAASDMGITVSDLSVDVAKMQEWKDGIVKKLTGGIGSLVRGNGADIVMGNATLTGPRQVRVTTDEGDKLFDATKAIVVATGTEVIQIPGFEADGERIITAREAVSLQKAPESLCIIGGGVIGLELGMVYMKLGTKVTVVELTDQLLPGVDSDLVRVVQKHLRKGKVDVRLKTKASAVEVTDGGVKVTVEGEKGTDTVEAETLLVAVGFRPNSKGLGLEEVGVELDDRGHIRVNEQLRTNVDGIYAIGDVTGGPYLAHKASAEAEVCAEVIAGHNRATDWRSIPAAIFTEPEIATAGMSETAAREAGRNVTIGKFPFAASGRAMAVRETDGFIKTIIDADNHRVIGVGIVGPEASESDQRSGPRDRDGRVRRRRGAHHSPPPDARRGRDGGLQARAWRGYPRNEPQVSAGRRRFHFYRVGRLAYAKAHDLQQRLVDARKRGAIEDTILLLEHDPVLTMGRRAETQNILFSRDVLAAQGVSVEEVGRGGDVTYHGPGQLVCYPIIDLHPDRRDVRKYVSSLEETMIRVAAEYGVEAGRVEGLNGAWVGDKKIGAVGVRISRWVTMHGFALNSTTELSHFQLIVPCGIADKGVTSLERETGASPPMREVEEHAARHFASLYEAEIEWHEGLPNVPESTPEVEGDAGSAG